MLKMSVPSKSFDELIDELLAETRHQILQQRLDELHASIVQRQEYESLAQTRALELHDYSLPDGWTVHTSRTSHSIYYRHKASGAIQWTKP